MKKTIIKYFKITGIALLAAMIIATAVMLVWKEVPFIRQGDVRDRSEVFQLYINDADIHLKKIIKRNGEKLEQLVLSKKERVPEFVEEVLSLKAKWIVCKQYTGIEEKDATRQFVQEKFEELLVSPEDLRSCLEDTVNSTIAEMERVENRLAVALRKELISRGTPSSELDNVEAYFREAVEQMTTATTNDTVRETARLAATEIGTAIVMQIIRQLSISAGILSISSATAGETMGITLVVGVLVDWIIAKATDVSCELEAKMNDALDVMAEDLSNEYQRSMYSILEQRSAEWTQTTMEALQ